MVEAEEVLEKIHLMTEQTVLMVVAVVEVLELTLVIPMRAVLEARDITVGLVLLLGLLVVEVEPLLLEKLFQDLVGHLVGVVGLV